MKTTIVLIVAAAAFFSCERAAKPKPEAVRHENFHSTRNYEYADAMGKRVIIRNSLPMGTAYTAPDGDRYFRVVFRSSITNETDDPLRIAIHFPAAFYDGPGLPGKHLKILVASDTVAVHNDRMDDNGMTDLKFYLDRNINRPSAVTQTIQPKESAGFYFVLLSLTSEITAGTTMRTGLNLKGRNLVYKIARYASKQGFPLLSEKEINCGSINVVNLMRQK